VEAGWLVERNVGSCVRRGIYGANRSGLRDLMKIRLHVRPTLLVVPVPAQVLLLFRAGRDGIFLGVWE